MIPLKHKVRTDNSFGGPMTNHKSRDGYRTRNRPTHYGTVQNGKVPCDPDGHINARKLHNDSSRALAVAKNLFHEVYGKTAVLQPTTVTDATIVNAVADDLKWIADTGASMDFLGENHLSAEDKKKTSKVGEPKRCSTGGGPVLINKRIKLNYTSKHRTNAWVMPNRSPPCVSVGQRCLKEGWGFYWSPNCNPVMISPDGTLFKLQSLRNVPYLSSDGEDQSQLSLEQMQ